MALSEFVQGCLDQHYHAMLRSIDGLSQEELSWMPTPECSSIGFLVWHYARTLDRWVQFRAQGTPQLWEGGWAERMGRSAGDPNDTGYGYTPQQLEEFVVPPVSILVEYAEAVRARAGVYIGSLDDDDFQNATVVNPRGGTIDLAAMFQQLVWEFNQHGGQIAYLRGMQRGLEDAGYSGGVLESLAAKESQNG